MAHERNRFLIQHIDTKLYIKLRTDHRNKWEHTDDPWHAWSFSSEQDAFQTKETNTNLPHNREAYRIVKTIDQREVEEDERLQTSVQQGME